MQDPAEKYDGEERRRWHIKKEVSLGDLIAFASAALAVVYAYTTLDKRVSILEDADRTRQIMEDRKSADFIRYQQRIDTTLDRINDKLDRLIDRRQAK
jgi:hypothetical protein